MLSTDHNSRRLTLPPYPLQPHSEGVSLGDRTLAPPPGWQEAVLFGSSIWGLLPSCAACKNPRPGSVTPVTRDLGASGAQSCRLRARHPGTSESLHSAPGETRAWASGRACEARDGGASGCQPFKIHAVPESEQQDRGDAPPLVCFGVSVA